jgi:multiple sugar transport system substrate-binding protein
MDGYVSQRIFISLDFSQVLHSLGIRSDTTGSLFLVVVFVLNVASLGNFGFLLSDTSTTSVFAQSQRVQKETLTVVLANEERWDPLIDGAKQELQRRHPDKVIEIQNRTLPYEEVRPQMLEALGNGTSIDLISIDQIWLGEFAENGLLTDLTNFTKKGISSSDFYQANWDGGVYESNVYAIWIWTDVRGTWYWKDLLNKAAVDPNSLKTWDGYIDSAKKLNEVLRPEGIEGAHLVGADHSPDMWYPYLWMLGGEILNLKSGHTSRDVYWFPAFNSTEGVKALNFIKNQTEIADIRPQKNHTWGAEFVDRKFAVMIEGSWMPGEFEIKDLKSLEQKVGFIPMFPVPDQNTNTSTMMGGWELAIPKTSNNKDLAWEFLTLLIEPRILVPMLKENGYLPTQTTIGEGPYGDILDRSLPYYKEMVSMIPLGRQRPSIPEYSQIADSIRQAIDDVYSGTKEPKQALDDAAAKAAEVLGW